MTLYSPITLHQRYTYSVNTDKNTVNNLKLLLNAYEYIENNIDYTIIHGEDIKLPHQIGLCNLMREYLTLCENMPMPNANSLVKLPRLSGWWGLFNSDNFCWPLISLQGKLNRIATFNPDKYNMHSESTIINLRIALLNYCILQLNRIITSIEKAKEINAGHIRKTFFFRASENNLPAITLTEEI